jgi:hypothetical protein
MWHWIARQLPTPLLYWCVIVATARFTHHYEDRVVDDISPMEIARFLEMESRMRV